MSKPEFSRKKKQSGTFSLGLTRHWRFHLLVFFIALGAGVILFRLYVLQVVAYEKYQKIADNQHSLVSPLHPERGEVFLQDEGEPYPLAVNRHYQMAYLVPSEISEAPKVIREISSSLGMEEKFIAEKVARSNDPFEIVKHRLSDEEAAKIRALNLAGVYLLPETFRYYPGGELAAQTIGFVGMRGDEHVGQYGIEAAWEERLRGTSGSVEQEQDAGGRWIPIAHRTLKPAHNGDTVTLTINRVIQYEVEKILRQTVEEKQAQGGSIVVMETKTGKILGMASHPQFNPNDYSTTENIGSFLNPVVSLAYEPGSIMKPITMAMGLEEGKISPTSEYVDPGKIAEAGYIIKNAEEKTYGRQTMYGVLDHSINTGAIYIEKLVGNLKFAEYLRRFGFGEKTGVDLPAELPGNIRNLDNIRGHLQFYTASFGQGITATPLQLIMAYNALGNAGILVKPYLVESVTTFDGRTEIIQPEVIRRVVSEETSRAMSVMLRSVVVNGHGKRADVKGFLVGGKTGTAQVAKPGEKGYDEGLTIGSFVGYAPTDDPQFTVLVKIDNPKGVIWAESSAAPAFAQVMKFLLEYSKIPPTETGKP